MLQRGDQGLLGQFLGQSDVAHQRVSPAMIRADSMRHTASMARRAMETSAPTTQSRIAWARRKRGAPLARIQEMCGDGARIISHSIAADATGAPAGSTGASGNARSSCVAREFGEGVRPSIVPGADAGARCSRRCCQPIGPRRWIRGMRSEVTAISTEPCVLERRRREFAETALAPCAPPTRGARVRPIRQEPADGAQEPGASLPVEPERGHHGGRIPQAPWCPGRIVAATADDNGDVAI